MYKACVSFSCYELSMTQGEVREISNPTLVADLLKAGYIVPFEPTAEIKEEVKAEKETKRKGKTK